MKNNNDQEQPTRRDFAKSGVGKAAYMAPVILAAVKATESVAAETPETLEGPSGFWWYKIPRAEFHLNNIRHVQHHAAQMSLCLRTSAGSEIDWVASGFKIDTDENHE